MKVNISVVGRFHAFDLAKQLQRNNVLNLLNTTYPKFIVKRWGIDKAKIRSNYFLEFLNRFVYKYVPTFLKSKINIYVKIKQAKSNIKDLKSTDILIGWSGSSLEAFVEAKKNKKIITVLERGSSHFTYQMNILEEEYSKFGKSFNPDYKTWQRELLEYELADYISIPSSFVERTFLEYGFSKSKLLLNPYGVDLSAFKQIKKQDDVFRVVCAGSFTLQKGVQYLLKAFYELNLPNSELIHLGKVNDETNELINKYSCDKIKFMGHQEQSSLYKFYSQGSVFAMMSIQDGFGMVLTQAMACGLPIITSSNTGGEDLITENGKEGFVIPIRNVESLKEKLLFLYENPEKTKKMGEAAKNRVAKGFSWDDYGDRYISNLNKIQNIDEN
jgi:glycosyltransferase involved in cell wall biosynthesis